MRRNNSALIQYKPAKFRNGKRPYIEYYAHDPILQKLRRKKIHLDWCRDAKELRETKNRIIQSTNHRLASGWNPFTEASNNLQYTRTMDALDMILKLKQNQNLETRTMDSYKSTVKIFYDWLRSVKMESSSIYEIDKQRAQHFIDRILIARKLKAKSLNGYLSNMRMFFNVLVDRGFLFTNPFNEIQMMREAEKDRETLTHAEQKKLQQHLLRHDYDFYFVCGYTLLCGLRGAEIARLKVGDVDLKNRMIIVKGSSSKTNRKRIVPIISDEFYDRLKNYLEKYPKDNFLITAKMHPGIKTEARLSNRIGERFRIVSKELKFRKGITFYSLKDTLASRLAESDVNAKKVMSLLGHSSLDMTDKYLSKWKPVVDDSLRNLVKF